MKMKKLLGSEKQIAWAESIREEILNQINNLKGYIEKMDGRHQERTTNDLNALENIIMNQDSSKWFIENAQEVAGRTNNEDMKNVRIIQFS